MRNGRCITGSQIYLDRVTIRLKRNPTKLSTMNARVSIKNRIKQSSEPSRPRDG